MELVKVLLVDDEVEVTKILSKRLGRRGYDCQTAANGQEAVDAMRQFPFGIVIMFPPTPGQWPPTAAQYEPAFVRSVRGEVRSARNQQQSDSEQ